MIELKLPEDEPKRVELTPMAAPVPVATPKELVASVSTIQPASLKTQPSFVPLAGAFLLGALLSFVVIRELDRGPIDRGQDDQRQVIDDGRNDGQRQDKTIPNTFLKDCKLIVVRDKKTTDEDAGYRTTIQNDTFWRVTAPSIVKDVEFLEDDDEPSKRLIAAAGIPAPFVMLANSVSKKMVWVIPLPKNGVTEIERKLK